MLSQTVHAARRVLSRQRQPRTVLRQAWLGLLIVSALAAAGCEDEGATSEPQLVWGRKGISNGRLQKPRAMAIDSQDQLYIVDMTARIQVFTPDGEFLRFWQTPVHTNGRPTGLSFDRKGRLLVADTHYFRVLAYSPEGELLFTLGGTQGHGPGEFGFVTDAVDDSHGNLYVAEYGEYDRIQKFSPDGKFLLQWGGHGFEPGQFVRPQNLAVDEQDRIWAVDACNHRIQVFDTEGKLLDVWGEQGSEPGQLYYPYDLIFDEHGDLYVCEYGNHRVQKFTRSGKSLGCWGRHGRRPGELHHPWALVRDSQGRIHVLDTLNHRVQRIVM
ncbi:MAG TPA: NHL repeat-containing protein [Pirellulales bacterium]|nr:NHL repeat-containing protein [Pirellulales bacterium]